MHQTRYRQRGKAPAAWKQGLPRPWGQGLCFPKQDVLSQSRPGGRVAEAAAVTQPRPLVRFTTRTLSTSPIGVCATH
jgi:hypothetical protein